MGPFEVFPFDALLLGLCWGEYENHDLADDCSMGGFYGFLTRRLSLFAPSFRVNSRVSVTESQVGAETVWLRVKPESSWELGVAQKYPCTLLIRWNSEPEIRAVTVDLGRSSFFDLLIDYLGGAMRLEVESQFSCVLAGHPDVASNWSVLVDAFRDHKPIVAEIIECRSDDLPRLKNRIRDLIASNECQPYFDLGCSFGELAAGFDHDIRYFFLFRDALTDDDEPSTVSGTSAWSIERLLKNRLVASQPAARALLQTAIDWMPEFEGGGRDDDVINGTDVTMMEAMRWLSQTQHAVWLAFSQLARVVNDADLLPRTRDAASHVPRTFRTIGPAGTDAIRRDVMRAEGLLSAATVDELTPAEVVRQFAGAIETLVRRTWPDDFEGAGNRPDSLCSVLHAKLQTEARDSTARRFASVALTLHTNYRNPSIHRVDEFRCSIQEARMFVAGIRALIEISDEIRGDV